MHNGYIASWIYYTGTIIMTAKHRVLTIAAYISITPHHTCFMLIKLVNINEHTCNYIVDAKSTTLILNVHLLAERREGAH